MSSRLHRFIIDDYDDYKYNREDRITLASKYLKERLYGIEYNKNKNKYLPILQYICRDLGIIIFEYISCSSGCCINIS